MPEFRLPGDLSKLSRAELAKLKEDANTELHAIFNRDTDEDPHTLDDATEASRLADAMKQIAAADKVIEAAEHEAAQKVNDALATARADAEAAMAAMSTPSGDDGADQESDPATEDAGAPELVTASGKNKAVTETPVKGMSLNNDLRTFRLREAAAEQAKRTGLILPADQGAEFVITASANIPDFREAHRFANALELADAFSSRARALPTTNGTPYYAPVANIKNEFDTVLSDRTPAAQVDEAFRKLTDPQRLWQTRRDGNAGITVAGGGWCAPSVNRYNFFNMACEDGAIDLPTTGIERGGVNFPTSPSLADVFTGSFTSGTNPWLWTETDDVATVTGSPNKPCVRVPCPSYTNVRLECYGICLTAGNLIDNAFPEAVQHQISLLNSALFHASNTRYIQQMVTLSSPVVTAGAGGAGVISPVLYTVELAAEDYRTRYGMCQTDVLEVVLPHWIIPAMRADATKRTGVDMVNVTDNMIADWFDTRHIRAQFVSDWQVRTTGLPGFTANGGMNSWPTTVDFLIYAAGTFVRGNGMSLNLGVVRDSTLNAENDFTALWMEECHLIARFGVESRQYRVNICADGTTGAADLTSCLP